MSKISYYLFFISSLFMLLNLNLFSNPTENDSAIYLLKSESQINEINSKHKLENIESKLETQLKTYEKEIPEMKTQIQDSKFGLWDLFIILSVILTVIGIIWGLITKKTIPQIVKEKIEFKVSPIIETVAKDFVNTKGELYLAEEIERFRTSVDKEIERFRISVDEKVAAFDKQENNSIISVEKNISLPSDNSEQNEIEGHIPTNLIFQQAFRTKSIKTKISLYEHVLKRDKNHFQAANNLGVLYQELGYYDRSIEYFNLSISINQNYHLAYVNKAESLINLLKYSEALSVVNLGIKLLPSFENGYIKKAIILLNTNKVEQAFKFMNEAISKHPNNPILVHDKGFLHYLNHEYDLSIIDYVKAADLNYPFMAQIMNNIAVSYRMKKDYKLALDYLDKAKSFNKNFPLIYGTTALIYADQEDDINFYKYIGLSLHYGCPIWDYLDDPGLSKYKNQAKLREFIDLYRDLDRDSLV